MDGPPLPPPVRDVLCLLARRVRRRQWLRAAVGTALALGLLYLALLGLNAVLVPGRTVLRGALALTAVLAAVLTWRLGLRPLRCRPNAAALAGLIERHHPTLAERLSTLVALSQADQVHGNPAFIAALGRQTANQLRALDIGPVLAEFPMPRRAFLGIGVLALALLALAWQPGHGAFCGRLLACCQPAPPLTFDVTPGDAHVLRGGTVRIALCIRGADGAPIEPADGALVLRQGKTTPTRLALTATGQGSFVAEHPAVSADSCYHVEADGERSAEYRLTVVPPAQLSGLPHLHIEAPPYLAADRREQTMTAGGEAAILQYSRVRLTCTFTRSPRRAALVLCGDAEAPVIVPFAFDATGRIGTATYLADVCGRWRVVVQTEVEHGLTSADALPGWTVRADTPPRFETALRMHGLNHDGPLPEGARIAPDDVLRVETHVADDEGLAAVELEYRVNDETPRVERWLDGAGQTALSVQGLLPLPAHLKDGDRLRYRLRAIDNRRLAKGALRSEGPVPLSNLAPQITCEPAPRDGADRWIELRIDARASPLHRQEVAARHDALGQKIAEFRKILAQERQHVAQLKVFTHQGDILTMEQTRNAAAASALHRTLTASLQAAGRELLTDPAMAPLAEHLLDVAAEEMRRGAEGLRAFVARGRRRAGREQALRDVETALAGAARKLEALAGANDALVRDQLDGAEAERLAGRQDALRRWLERLLREKTPREAEEELARLGDEQAKVEAALERLRARSRQFQAAPAEQLADAAEEMAADQRQAAAAEQARLRGLLGGRLKDLAGRQDDLARRATALAGPGGPTLAEAAAAAALLRQGQLGPAIGRQRRAEERLRDWADALRGDPRTAAAYLARLQQQLHTELEKSAVELAHLKDEQALERLRPLAERQQRVQDAATRLKLSAGDAEAQRLRQAAVTEAGKARAALAATRTLDAAEAMQRARGALDELARRLPEPPPQANVEAKRRAAIESLESEQARLRAEAEQLLREQAGAGAGPAAEAAKRAEQLQAQALKLAQNEASAEAKRLANESAHALGAARKAMQAGQDMNAKGEPGAGKAQEEAALQLERAAAKLRQSAEAAMGQKKEASAANRLDEGLRQVKEARRRLDAEPKQAPQAMRQAARALGSAAQRASAQARQALPRPTGRAGQPPPGSAGDGGPMALPTGPLTGDYAGRPWGELPGELRARLVQDLRARYGDDYAEAIRRYFEQLAR